jgi:hypothetical protein
MGFEMVEGKNERTGHAPIWSYVAEKLFSLPETGVVLIASENEVRLY